MKYIVCALFLGFVLDLMLGDPHWLYHPVRAIGALIAASEKLLRKLFPGNPRGELAAGVCLVVIVTVISSAVPAGLLYLAHKIHPWAAFVLCVWFDYQLLAARALQDESMKVYRELEKHDLPAARKAVSMIVGRDTEILSEEGVAKAAIETVAENASDGVIAPMLFLAIGGPVLGFFYKSVNTMDSMVGYKNDRYLYFGRAAAKLDDVLNYIPARLSALLIILSTRLVHYDTRGAWQIYCRDRNKHASPNSAHTEAAVAGALGIQLAGDASYFGKVHKKPLIGDKKREVETADIRRANLLMLVTASVTMSLLLLIHVLADFCMNSMFL